MKHGERERTLYLPCIAPGKEDYLAVVDVDESSQTYSTVVHRTYTGNTDDELHHTGWNACSSCYGDSSKSRKYLVAPALKSGNIYFFDVSSEREPTLHHVLLGSQIKEQVGLTWPHTSHCLPSGEIMISHMGNKDESSAGNFLLVDSEDFSIKGKWIPQDTKFGYDFWYQPRHNIMVSSEWGEPSKLKHHFDPSHVAEFYGHTLHFWNWNERTLLKSIELGDKGRIPLEVRFLHNPSAAIGFVGAALSSSIILIYQREDGEWNTVPVIEIPPISVDGWALPKMPALITDILVSLDDRFLYLSNWLHGDIRQYNIEDPHHPRLVGQIYLGGSIRPEGPVTITDETVQLPEIQTVNGKTFRGGPQMLQLSLDGKRLYVTNSLFSSWDKQFYPGMYQDGSQLLQILVDNEKGGLTANQNFLVDFAEEPDGPVLAHEVRYPGGDCTSDIWL
eukprot:TRINITY_DN9093_c0_g1_i1.p1 TRINITY_DN9093_c0_g1~~TRINITY_DN9093_c0_g1_i1.p1  ORF type:complete len:471 (+),score=92.14 TRINITY_DN9093_c0_g1_i1:74-1414(+)